jgi:hypothetical protein
MGGCGKADLDLDMDKWRAVVNMAMNSLTCFIFCALLRFIKYINKPTNAF